VKYLESAVRKADASAMLNLETYTHEGSLIVTKAEGCRPMVGRLLEAMPLVGGGGEFAMVLNSALKSAPDESVVQVNLLCGPDFTAADRYMRGKSFGSGLVSTLIDRQRLVLEGATRTGWRQDVPPLNHRMLFASLSVPVSNLGEEALAEAARRQSDFFMNMQSSGFPEVQVRTPAEVAAVCRQFANPLAPRPVVVLDELQEYKRQVFGSDQVFDFRDPRIGSLGPNLYCQAVAVKFYPRRPSLGIMNLVTGGVFNEGTSKEGGGPRILTPFMISTTVRVANQRKESMRVVQAIDSRRNKKAPFKLGNEDPAAKLEDLLAIQQQCADGEDKYVHVSTTAFLFATTAEEASAAAAQLRGTFEKLGFDAREVAITHGVRFAQALPLNFSPAIAEKLQGEAIMGSSAACATLPLYGDYTGNLGPKSKVSGLPLITRRGQLLHFEPSTANIAHGAIIGQTGSGKSFGSQGVMMTLLAQGAQLVAIDDGRTLKKFCHGAGGTFVEFGNKANVKPSLNPFTFLDEDGFEQEEGTITSLILLMAYDDEKPEDGARIALSESVKAAWSNKQNDADLYTVLRSLEQITNGAAQSNNETEVTRAATNLIPRLKAFVDSPSRGDYFRGKGSLDVHGAFTVFELGGIEDKHLKKCVMYYVMNMVISRLKTLPGSKYVFVDEAMDTLKDPAAEEVLKGLYYKGRKDAVWVWTIWQSWLQLAKLPAGRVVLAQSQWKIVLSQDQAEITQLIKEELLGRFNADTFFQRMLRSVRTVKNDYSEMLVISAETYEVGRLYFDRFTTTLLDSESDTRTRIFELMEAGVDVVEAVNSVLGDGAAKRRRWIREFVDELCVRQGLTADEVLSEVRGVLNG